MIIYKATSYARSHRHQIAAERGSSITNGASNKRKSEMTRSILIITFSYVLLTLPAAIVNGYFFVILNVMDYGPIIINIFGSINFSFPACNFFTLLYSNKIFAKELKSIIGELREQKTKRIKVNPKEQSRH